MLKYILSVLTEQTSLAKLSQVSSAHDAFSVITADNVTQNRTTIYIGKYPLVATKDLQVHNSPPRLIIGSSSQRRR